MKNGYLRGGIRLMSIELTKVCGQRYVSIIVIDLNKFFEVSN